jgi:hypothetical protein
VQMVVDDFSTAYKFTRTADFIWNTLVIPSY